MSILTAAIIGYIIGAAPIIYHLAKWRGINLRFVGTGNIGTSNTWRHGGRRLGTIAIIADLGKGMLAPFVAYSLNLGTTAELIAGISAVAGQMWPVTLGFNGGRGNATAGGAALVLFPSGFFVAAVAFIILTLTKVLPIVTTGSSDPSPRSRTVPIAILLSFALYSAIAFGVGHQIASLAGIIFIALILVRRVTAPWPLDPETGAPLERSLLSILLLDRPTPKAPR